MPGPRTIRLLTLGPPEVRVDDRPVGLSPKLLALLVHLSVASPRRPTRRDTLLAAFWPERDSSRARNALSQALHRLRGRLGPEVVESRGQQELVVNGHLRSDVDRFDERLDAEEFEEALAVYRGEFLEGFHLSGAPEFERWLDGVRARIRREAREAALRLAAREEQAGRTAEAAGRLRRAFEIVPTDEAITRRLIRLHLETGERDAALRAYRRLARRMDATLGAPPSDETRSLLEDTGGVPAVPGSVPDVVTPPPPARRIAGDLTERAGQLLEAGRAKNAAARELLAQATGLDPGYAPAQATYSEAISRWVQLFGGPWEEANGALDAARLALKADPDLPAAHFARAFSLETVGRLEEAIRGYRTLLDARPDHLEATAHLGRTLTFAGDFQAALQWTETVRERVGPEPDVLLELGMLHHCLGQDDEGEEGYTRALEARPGFRWAEGSWTYFDFVRGRRRRARERAERMLEREPDNFIALTYSGNLQLADGDPEEAIGFYEQCYRLDPDSRDNGILRATRTVLGFAHTEGGDPSRGRKLLAAAEREDRQALQAGGSFGGLYYDLASIYAARGETGRALDWLERSYRAGWLQHEFLDVDPLMDSLRGEDRFAEVSRAMKRNVREQRERLQ